MKRNKNDDNNYSDAKSKENQNKNIKRYDDKKKNGDKKKCKNKNINKSNRGINKILIRSLRKKLKRNLNKLNEQHEYLEQILKNINYLKFDHENERQEYYNELKNISKELKYAYEINNDDIALLKIERDLIKSEFTKSRKSLKIFNYHIPEECLEDEDMMGCEKEKIGKCEKRKKKKRRNNTNNSQNYINSLTPLQNFHANTLCVKCKCDHHRFSAEYLNIKNSVVLDLFNTLSKNKYFKETNICEQSFFYQQSNRIYKQEKKKLIKNGMLPCSFLLKKKNKVQPKNNKEENQNQFTGDFSNLCEEKENIKNVHSIEDNNENKVQIIMN
ncbi:asparagine-rich protein [Plasmodium falciparum RAJ116]|uniref:Asparagine-rich protein n=1 Tax=Plasmodium falciparum RAJ116 TaxID=580058 RepID=A0A0L0CV34_PLAFA|nr:asparagine-rich protein [Plasmodium falciparum RAJ116]